MKKDHGEWCASFPREGGPHKFSNWGSKWSEQSDRGRDRGHCLLRIPLPEASFTRWDLETNTNSVETLVGIDYKGEPFAIAYVDKVEDAIQRRRHWSRRPMGPRTCWKGQTLANIFFHKLSKPHLELHDEIYYMWSTARPLDKSAGVLWSRNQTRLLEDDNKDSNRYGWAPHFDIRTLLPRVSPFLVQIFWASLSLGFFPSLWNETKVLAVRKPGKASYKEAQAYKPISLLFCKIIGSSSQYTIKGLAWGQTDIIPRSDQFSSWTAHVGCLLEACGSHYHCFQGQVSGAGSVIGHSSSTGVSLEKWNIMQTEKEQSAIVPNSLDVWLSFKATM